ncbi:S8 family serine peptidase, partial [Arthrobacter deserti]|nr:S8 family serine peptidase [Arthrobacter deserti]
MQTRVRRLPAAGARVPACEPREGAVIESDLPARSDVPPSAGGPGTARATGRHIVVFAEQEQDPSAVLASAGLSNVAPSRDFHNRAAAVPGGADAIIFDTLGIAVVAVGQGQLGALRASGQAQAAVLSVSPELVHHVLAPGSGDYVRGYRDGVADLAARLGSGAADGAAEAAAYQDTARFTWGLQATRASSSTLTGRGVRVAVLDTGLDLAHPDFAGRGVTAVSFIEGESAQDGHGHGTHCAGVCAGPAAPSAGPRYGVAPEAEISAGKVLADSGPGTDAGILAGIDWAVAGGCAV